MGLAGRTLAIGLAALVAGVAHSWVRPITLTVQENTQSTAVVLPDAQGTGGTDEPVEVQGEGAEGETPAGQVTLGVEITLEEALALMEQAGAPFVDARSDELYEASHVLGAIHLSPDAFAGGTPEAVLTDLAGFEDAPIVVYCTGGDCHDSHSVAAFLQRLGFQEVHVMVAGMDAWAEAYPDLVAAGTEPTGSEGGP